MTFEPLAEHMRSELIEIIHAGAIAAVGHHG